MSWKIEYKMKNKGGKDLTSLAQQWHTAPHLIWLRLVWGVLQVHGASTLGAIGARHPNHISKESDKLFFNYFPALPCLNSNDFLKPILDPKHSLITENNTPNTSMNYTFFQLSPQELNKNIINKNEAQNFKNSTRLSIYSISWMKFIKWTHN